MKNNKTDNDDPGVEITEQPTGEYLALGDNGKAATPHSAEPSGTARAPAREETQSVKAAFWLTHLENEVTRLHAKWQSIDAEFKTREARIAELHEEIAVTRSHDRAGSGPICNATPSALKAADERLASKDGEITALVENRRARDERIAAMLDGARGRRSRAQSDAGRNRARAQAETARLNDSVRREQSATAATNRAQRATARRATALQAKLQDLEIYINGRHDRWSELNAELAELQRRFGRHGKDRQSARRRSSPATTRKRRSSPPGSSISSVNARSWPAGARNARQPTKSCNRSSRLTSSRPSSSKPSTPIA